MAVRDALALLLLGLSGAAPAIDGARDAGAPAPFEHRYEVLRNGSPLGEATLALRHVEGATWVFTTRTRGTRGLAGLAGAAIDERSEFTWRDGRPELLRYRYRQDVAFRTRERALDRAGANAIDSRDGDRRHRLAFEPGTMDRHLVVLAIGADLARGADGELRYRVADRDHVEWHRYRVAGRERIGALDTIRVERLRDNAGRTTTSWLAPALGYAPARIVQREADGETIELRLRRD
jgi:hypothetical protein